MIKGYIFDYGGTLDTCGCHWGMMLWHSYQKNNVHVTEEQFRKAYVFAERTLGKNPIIQPDYTFYKTLDVKIRIEFEYLVDNKYLTNDDSTICKMHDAVLNDLYQQVRTITAHSRDVLLQLKRKYPMVLVSNFYGNVNVVLHEFGFDTLFDDVIESAVVGIRKPDARIFSLGVLALGLKENEVVVVGDSFYKDIEPANKIGCSTIWFKGEGWTNDEVFDESIPSRIITDISQIL